VNAKEKKLCKADDCLSFICLCATFSWIFISNGRNNDASILKSLLRPDTPLNEYLRPGDLGVVERGFMDSRKVEIKLKSNVIS